MRSRIIGATAAALFIAAAVTVSTSLKQTNNDRRLVLPIPTPSVEDTGSVDLASVSPAEPASPTADIPVATTQETAADSEAAPKVISESLTSPDPASSLSNFESKTSPAPDVSGETVKTPAPAVTYKSLPPKARVQTDTASSEANPERSGALPITVSRDDVRQGMTAVAARAKKCGKKENGMIVMVVTISKSGIVTDVSAAGSFVGTDVGECVARAVRTARFPSAVRDITIKYPFQL